MSDYQMLNYTGNLLQQQQQQQQQQQHQQHQQHQHQQQQQQQQMAHQAQQLQDNQPTMEQTRAWQQIQQIQQFNRPPGSVDMNSANPAQFAEMIKRSQNLSQTHAARVAQQQQQQQQFNMGVGMNQMNAGGAVMGGSASQQMFHDSSSSHLQPSYMPSGFQNMTGVSPINSSMPSRNGQNGIPNFQPALSRQLELMNMAQNQQSQNGPINMNKFNQQQQHQINQMREQQQQQQKFQSNNLNHSSPDLFSPPVMSNDALRRPSPHPAMQQAPMSIQGSQSHPGSIINTPNGGPRLTYAEMKNRLAQLQSQITNSEQNVQSLSIQHIQARGTPQEAAILQKLQDANQDLAKRRDFFKNMNFLLNQQHKQTPAQVQPGSNPGPALGQPTWTPHPNSNGSVADNQSPRNQFQAPQQSPSSLSQQQTNSIQPSPSLTHSQPSGPHPINTPFVPPRPATTPQQNLNQPSNQLPGSPFNSMQPPLAAQFSFPNNSLSPSPMSSQQSQPGVVNTQPGPNGLFNPSQSNGLPIPLDKNRFETFFKSFCGKHNLKLDPRLISIDNRPVELHRLHVEVMKEGGLAKVEQKDMWHIIGARVGFVQFPGTDVEPAKSGPAVAQTLAHIYKEYLNLFDTWFVAQTMENQKRMQGMNGNMQAPFQWSGPQMQRVIQMSQMSVADLHAQGVDEKTISFVETHRASLQRAWQEQVAFGSRMRSANRAQPPQTAPNQHTAQNGGHVAWPIASSSATPFPMNPAVQINPAAANMARQQIIQQQQLFHQQQQQAGQSIVQEPRVAPRAAITLVQAESLIKRLKLEFHASVLPNLPSMEVPGELHAEYLKLLDELSKTCSDSESKLPMIVALIKPEELVKKLINIICTVQEQRRLCAIMNNNRYIVGLDGLRTMIADTQRLIERFTAAFNYFRQQQSRPPPQLPISQNPGQQLTPVFSQQANLSQTAPNPINEVFPQSHIPSNGITNQPTIPPSIRHPAPPVSLQSSVKRGQKTNQMSGSTNAVSTPSPAPQSASTPVASAQTPSASSPPATKSPKARPQPSKAKGGQPSRARRPSKAGQTPASPVPDTLASSNNVNAKRPREEDPVANNFGVSLPEVANDPSPPKRAKNEWESSPSEELKKKNESIDNIKTEEDATAFFDQMTEIIKIAGGEGQSALTTDISETLNIILKNYGYVPDPAEGSNSLATGDVHSVKESTPPLTSSNESFDEFIDFSFATVEEDEKTSKAATPDLVPSSSTGPSPESNPESDMTSHNFITGTSSISEIKHEEISDPLRLGIWKDIDGGEGAYYQSNEWKWEGPMNTLDQPWAIFNP